MLQYIKRLPFRLSYHFSTQPILAFHSRAMSHQQQSTTTTTPSVSIIGAGPSGLLLARYLQQHKVPVKIYEREASASARGQGGTLDLHEDTGLEALKQTGLLEEAERHMRGGEAEAMKIIDRDGKVWMDENGDEGAPRGRPEIDR